MSKPKILALDIETKPILAYVWGLYDQTISLEQIKEDWSILAWGAMWVDSDKVMYEDLRGSKDFSSDKKILKGIWKLMDEADIVLTQNGKQFDVKKLNARFKINGMKPPSSYRQIDTKQLAKKVFGFTSNKLKYMTSQLCTSHVKSDHQRFPGMSLWTECLKNNIAAWKEMEQYNKMDVLSLVELYRELQPWDNSVNFNVYSDDLKNQCACGSTEFWSNGHFYGAAGKYQRFRCKKCGAEARSRVNLLDKDKRRGMLK